jgi:HTH-type transcriptional repressor of NAD biosynthesis genes
MTLGFIVGKFYPPHRGHKYLIDTARAQVDRLIVMVAHHYEQTIPGEVRRDWLREIHPDCEVMLVPDTLGDDTAAWAKFTIEQLGRAPDVVFTSEDYGAPYAALMGCRHMLVDHARVTIPTSGTAVRANPLANLKYLEPCVRAYYVKRVVIVGAESTGKTTLAKKLAQHFQTNFVAEYGREQWERKVAGLTMNDPLPAWRDEEFLEIATEQQRRENEAAQTANKVLICDTNAFATGTWYERYRGQRDPVVDAIGQRDKVDLYLLTSPDVPFVQDGFRDGEAIREWMHERFAEQLAALPTPTVLLAGTFAERDTQAIAAVERLLNCP